MLCLLGQPVNRTTSITATITVSTLLPLTMAESSRLRSRKPSSQRDVHTPIDDDDQPPQDPVSLTFLTIPPLGRIHSKF